MSALDLLHPITTNANHTQPPAFCKGKTPFAKSRQGPGCQLGGSGHPEGASTQPQGTKAGTSAAMLPDRCATAPCPPSIPATEETPGMSVMTDAGACEFGALESLASDKGHKKSCHEVLPLNTLFTSISCILIPLLGRIWRHKAFMPWIYILMNKKAFRRQVPELSQSPLHNRNLAH